VKIESDNKQAFTLIEMVLAVGIAALALLCAASVLFTSIRLRNAASDMVDKATPVDQALAYLRRDLQCCVTPTNGTTGVLSGGFRVGNGIQSSGVGEPVAAEMFTATGALGERTPWADIQRVSYELKSSTDISGRRDLYRSVVRNLLSVNGTPEVDDQLLLANVENVRFSCYDGAQWLDVWDTTDYTSVNTNLPLAVRVQIQMAGADANEPVELVVPIDSESRTNAVLVSGSGS
jgi:type II secretion system protein J